MAQSYLCVLVSNVAVLLLWFRAPKKWLLQRVVIFYLGLPTQFIDTQRLDAHRPHRSKQWGRFQYEENTVRLLIGQTLWQNRLRLLLRPPAEY